MTGRLDEKVAIVTGAGQGIGAGIARALAADRATVVLAGRTASKLESVSEEIRMAGGAALAVRCDVTSTSDIAELVETVRSTYRRLDVLVNNAQSFTFCRIEDATDEDVELAYTSGVLGTLHVMQASLPDLRVRGGSVVNLATSSALIGAATFGPYAMAKEAIRALTKVAATEWGPYGIRVFCIWRTAASPAYLEYLDANPEAAASMAAARPLGRIGDPTKDIGRAVSALVSDDMQYLTGGTLMLNGGFVYL